MPPAQATVGKEGDVADFSVPHPWAPPPPFPSMSASASSRTGRVGERRTQKGMQTMVWPTDTLLALTFSVQVRCLKPSLWDAYVSSPATSLSPGSLAGGSLSPCQCTALLIAHIPFPHPRIGSRRMPTCLWPLAHIWTLGKVHFWPIIAGDGVFLKHRPLFI